MKFINPLKIFFYVIGMIRGYYAVKLIVEKFPEISIILNESSFGHTVTILDVLSRGYYPHNINVLVIETDKFNDYLKELFSDNVNFVQYTPLTKILKFSDAYQSIEGMGVSFCAGVISSLKSGSQHLLHGSSLYRFYNTNKTIPKYYSEKAHKLIKFNTFVNHKDLINNSKQLNRKLFQATINSINNKICNIVGDDYAGIITILIRKKQTDYTYQHDKLRDCDDENKYVDIAKYFSSKGYVVLVSGEANYRLYSKIDNVLDHHAISISKKLLNIFCLSESSLVICQHSGPVHLANTCNVPLVIADALPLWQGSANNNDLIVHKRFYDNNRCTYLSYSDIKEHYNSLFYGDYNLLDSLFLRIEGSKKSDIIHAVEEILTSKNVSILNDEEIDFIESYFDILPDDTLAHIKKTRPPMSVLKREFLSEVIH
jgi:putative glycosyltransferase (TIGR04372 family)